MEVGIAASEHVQGSSSPPAASSCGTIRGNRYRVRFMLQVCGRILSYLRIFRNASNITEKCTRFQWHSLGLRLASTWHPLVTPVAFTRLQLLYLSRPSFGGLHLAFIWHTRCFRLTWHKIGLRLAFAWLRLASRGRHLAVDWFRSASLGIHLAFAWLHLVSCGFRLAFAWLHSACTWLSLGLRLAFALLSNGFRLANVHWFVLRAGSACHSI